MSALALALAVVCGVTAAAVEDVHFLQLSMTICCDGSGRLTLLK